MAISQYKFKDIKRVTIDEIKFIRVWTVLINIKKQNFLSEDDVCVVRGFILSNEEAKDLF